MLGIVALVVAVPGLLAAVLWLAPFFRVSEVDYRTTPDRASALAASAPVEKGRPLVEVDTRAVHDAVLANPVFRAADVSRSWPSTLVVEATPRTPVVALQEREAPTFRLVDAEGVAYDSVAEVPDGVLTARADAPEDPGALRTLVAFVGALDPGLLSQVRDLNVDDRGRLTASLSRVEIDWGTAEDSALKAAVVRDLVGRAGVARVDVSVPMEPVTSATRRSSPPTSGAARETSRAGGDASRPSSPSSTSSPTPSPTRS
ncbi:cell division protein FtsQ/DivIB [Mobilicoccus pelagius]|uniref:cell division protein FtsQ/DivIB n=1 Tax=Mobilicoccus pelagius TaxID=746032 RepID=UPI00114682A7|nr:FtsQ-type POTRA domain-containing protein [Mobilicoccus pelagius]